MKYIVADSLSRRSRTKFDDINEKYIEDIDDFIAAQLDMFRVFLIKF